METSNRIRKPRRFSSIRLLFAHHANGNLSFVCLLTKKQTEIIRLQWLNGLAHLWVTVRVSRISGTFFGVWLELIFMLKSHHLLWRTLKIAKFLQPINNNRNLSNLGLLASRFGPLNSVEQSDFYWREFRPSVRYVPADRLWGYS